MSATHHRPTHVQMGLKSPTMDNKVEPPKRPSGQDGGDWTHGNRRVCATLRRKQQQVQSLTGLRWCLAGLTEKQQKKETSALVVQRSSQTRKFSHNLPLKHRIRDCSLLWCFYVFSLCILFESEPLVLTLQRAAFGSVGTASCARNSALTAHSSSRLLLAALRCAMTG